MSEEHERVTVQLLNGTSRSALLESFTGKLLQIRLSDAPNPEFRTGALVEVECKQALYLGEVQGRRDSLLIIAVEHAVKRSSLSALQDVWHCSQRA